MSGFPESDLALLRDVAEIRIAPYAEDGFLFPGRLVWVVVVNERVFVRSWKGRDAEWYTRASASRRARVTTDEEPVFAHEVSLDPVRDDETQNAIDAEYLRKYPPPYNREMTLPKAVETTFEVRPA